VEAILTEDVDEFLATAGDFLTARPVEHNLVLSIADLARGRAVVSRWAWVTGPGSEVVGTLVQSPTTFSATLTPMPAEAVTTLVDLLSVAAPDLPGVTGSAATAARFAGAWASARRQPVRPAEGMRLYRLGPLSLPAGVPGELVTAGEDDVETIVAWDGAFEVETGVARPRGLDRPALLAERVADGRFWLWRVDGRPVCMAFSTPPLAGAVRVGAVYTPPVERGHGYAGALVGGISERLLAAGARECLLYTQLTNPTSNGVYQRLGYEPLAEILAYAFDAVADPSRAA
jgi:GNAT superfamily N-acetyltransferase